MTTHATTGQRLRVLQVTHDLGVGGLPRVVETLARALDPQAFDVSVLCLNEGGPLADRLVEAGIRVDILSKGPRKPDRLAFLRVAERLRDQPVDVVHTHNTQPFIDAGLASIISSTPVLIHTDHARAFPDRKRYMIAEHLLSWGAHKVVGVSEHTTANLRHWERISEAKLETIPNGIDGSLFDAAVDVAAVRHSLGVPLDVPLLALGARLAEQKGITYLLDAMARLEARQPKLHLVLAGDGPLRSALEAQANALGLSQRVHFVGVRLDMPDVLRASDIFVMPSLWEGLPMIILEALAGGVPIVASSVGGVPSAVIDGQTGSLVPAQDPDRLADALHHMLEDAEYRARCVVNGRRLFDDHFSAAAMARRYEALYRSGAAAKGLRVAAPHGR